MSERALWDKVARTAEPLHPQKKLKPPEAAEDRVAPPLPPKYELQAFRVGEKAAGKNGTAASEPLVEATSPGSINRKAFSRLKQGRSAPEAKLDLHGMTVDVAHAALMRFILTSQARGLRLVLVITGKGRERPHSDLLTEQPGVLRRQVPRWLAAPPLRAVVTEVVPASRRHGGDGALYVFLRRLR